MITITNSAKEKIISILLEEKAEYLRFGLRGGGCNGFTYYLSIENNLPADDDLEIVIGFNSSVLVDPMSLMYLSNAEIDYKKDLMSESFVFNNPNATGHCGCNQSVGFG